MTRPSERFQELKRPFPIYAPFLVAAVLSGIEILQGYIPYLYDGDRMYNPWFGLAPSLINNFLWASLATVLYSVYQLTVAQAQQRRSRIAWSILAGAVVAILHSSMGDVIFLGKFYFESPDEFAGLLRHWKPNMVVGWVGSFISFWVLMCAFFALDFYNKYKNQQLEVVTMERELSDAKLSALRMQLNPHFLFNALHSAASLMDESVADAQRVIARLGNLLRRMLEEDRDHTVTLDRELEATRNYLDIEQVRFKDRLTVEYEIAPGALDAMVPNLILQPLVENAIKHGFGRRTDEGRIRVLARKHGDTLELEVEDDGSGCAKGAATKGQRMNGRGIGLSNTRERLDHLYGESFVFEVDSPDSGGFAVKLRIPYRTSASPDTPDSQEAS